MDAEVLSIGRRRIAAIMDETTRLTVTPLLRHTTGGHYFVMCCSHGTDDFTLIAVEIYEDQDPQQAYGFSVGSLWGFAQDRGMVIWRGETPETTLDMILFWHPGAHAERLARSVHETGEWDDGDAPVAQ